MRCQTGACTEIILRCPTVVKRRKGGEEPLSRQRRDEIGPGLDGVADGVVLSGRYPDGLSGEGDVVVVAGRVVALELGVVGLAGVVAFGNAGHRGREGRICHDRCSPRWMRVDMSLTLSESLEQALIRQYIPYGQAFWVWRPIVSQEGYEDGRREDRPGAHLRDEPGREVDLQDAAENGSAGRGV